MPKFIFTLIGLGLTVALGVFFIGVSQFFHYDPAFSEELFRNNLYYPNFFILAGLAWAVPVVFYYVINAVRFGRWWHWLLFAVLSMGLTAVLSLYYTRSQLEALQGAGIFADNFYVNFALVNVGFNFLLLVAASFSIRWWSSNCNQTPIPL